MGETQVLFPEELTGLHVGFDSESKGCSTAIALGDKIYTIGGSDDGATSSIGIRILDKLAGKSIMPTVLGTKPSPCKGYSALLLNKDRILIRKRDAAPDDFIWFLEVDTRFVKGQKKLLQTEVVAWSQGVIGEGPKPVIISGPSGVGKGTLISKLMDDFPSTFGFSVSHTTRAPRAKEKDGVHYHFIDRSVMEKDIRDGKFLEFASVHGNLYGTSIEAVETVTDLGKRCILDIDVQGARSVKKSSLEVMSIFICPPSPEELEKRLRTRGTETEEQIQKRLRNAKEELEEGQSSGLFDHILVNDDLETCFASLKKILGLDESTDAVYQPSAKSVDNPIGYSVSEMDQKVLIQCRDSELGQKSSSLCVLDVSSLKGGAPGRTRGLNSYAIDKFVDGLKGVQELKNSLC